MYVKYVEFFMNVTSNITFITPNHQKFRFKNFINCFSNVLLKYSITLSTKSENHFHYLIKENAEEFLTISFVNNYSNLF